jgi:hypothetical protein
VSALAAEVWHPKAQGARRRRSPFTVSLDLLLALIVIAVPIVLYVFVPADHPFIDRTTCFTVVLMSIALLVFIWLKHRAYIPALDVLVIVHVLFWHVRYATLALLPEYELVLTRSGRVPPEQFADYSVVVLISLLAAGGGILLARTLFGPRGSNARAMQRASAERTIAAAVGANVLTITLYCAACLAYYVIAAQIGGDTLPTWLGYMGFALQAQVAFFLSIAVQFATGVARRVKLAFVAFAVVFILITVLAGTRSGLLVFMFDIVFLFSLFGRLIRPRLSVLVIGVCIGVPALVGGFAFGTYQRQVREIAGVGITFEAASRAFERTGGLGDQTDAFRGIIGLAAARAGFLDYSAELYGNRGYEDIVTIDNIAKATVDLYVPGDVFDDSRRVSYRIRDIYDPGFIGYQSDALGAPGENYVLFGYGFPLAIGFVAFFFSTLLSRLPNSVVGLYVKFLVCAWIYAWWNSFGYDWLLSDMGQQVIVGSVVMLCVFWQRPRRVPRATMASATP